ncbi:MAG: hypothetical protein ABIH82_03345 [Candidatus Woesearchaeota archaeon]
MLLEVNAERYLVVNNRQIKHSGVFVGKDIFHEINHALEERGYEVYEKKSEDKVNEEGLNVYVELRPYKEKTSYVTLMIKFKIYLNNMTDIVKEVAGVTKNYQQGDALIVIDAWFMTEWESRWAMKPYVWFLKSMINKLVYIFPQEEGYRGELVEDAAYITNRIKRLFRSYREPEQAIPHEEEVRKSVEEDIGKEIKKQPEEKEEYLDFGKD